MQFLEGFVTIKDLTFKKFYLALLLKVTTTINKDIAVYYPSIIDSLFNQIKIQQEDKNQDAVTKVLIAEVVNKL